MELIKCDTVLQNSVVCELLGWYYEMINSSALGVFEDSVTVGKGKRLLPASRPIGALALILTAVSTDRHALYITDFHFFQDEMRLRIC